MFALHDDWPRLSEAEQDPMTRPLDWRSRLLQRALVRGDVSAIVADQMTLLAWIAATGRPEAMYDVPRAGLEKLQAVFHAADCLAHSPDRRYAAELFELAGYPPADVAQRLLVEPVELATFLAMRFDLVGRRSAADFLVRAAAVPELGLLPDRLGRRRFAWKVLAVYAGQDGLRQLLGDDPVRPRAGGVATGLPWSEFLAQHEYADDLSEAICDLFGPQSDATPAQRKERRERLEALLEGMPTRASTLAGLERLAQGHMAPGSRQRQAFGVDGLSSVTSPVA